MKKALNNKIIAVIGLGYVGLQTAYYFSKKFKVIGFDISVEKINLLRKGMDSTKEIGEKIKKCKIDFTNNSNDIKPADYLFVAVPTPASQEGIDISYLLEATRIVGNNMMKNATVIFESTVFPGATQDVCIPLLSKESGYIYNKDFYVVFSPERINPGDKIHKFNTINKLLACENEQKLIEIKELFKTVLNARIITSDDIRAVESSKLVENIQRDINIALMNELANIHYKLDIDFDKVLKYASSKWNFLNFKPGLVGGHCIGVDTYYLLHKKDDYKESSALLETSRKINETMPQKVAERLIANLEKMKMVNPKILILGVTYKANTPNVRNSKVFDLVSMLKDKFSLYVEDTFDIWNDVEKLYNFKYRTCENADVILLAVAHVEILKNIANYLKLIKSDKKIIFDITNSHDMIKSSIAGEYIYKKLI